MTFISLFLLLINKLSRKSGLPWYDSFRDLRLEQCRPVLTAFRYRASLGGRLLEQNEQVPFLLPEPPELERETELGSSPRQVEGNIKPALPGIITKGGKGCLERIPQEGLV